LVFSGIVIITVLIRERLRPKYRPFVPNWGAIGLAWVISNPQNFAVAMTLGAVLAYFVQRFRPIVWTIHGYPFAAGLSAGEACSGLVTAGLVIAGKDGDHMGSKIGEAWP
jgi:uncharacterized oligopeptide transporter (OPT) family protein